MDKTWLELHLQVPAAAVDLVGSALTELGCTGLTVEERQLDTFVAPDPDEPATADYQVRAYFARPADLDALRQEVREQLEWLATIYPGLSTVVPNFIEVRNEDWAEGWKQHFSAVRIGRRLVVKPTWEVFAREGDEVVIELDPGMAFGTGTHGTTRLCLEAVAALFEERVRCRVLDVGTGSGILAIAAAALGAERVLACDIDADACAITAENARLNHVSDRVEVSEAPLEALEGGFDLVLANILAEENIRLGDELVARVAPGGALVLSGILIEKEPLVRAAFTHYPLTPPLVSHREEWSCLLYYKVG